ncbi:cytochrome bd oxidase small subunit, CydX/CbdX family [Vibrio albus]|uniref:Cytochrome bd oxidase small subunit, CydX/CbdX family n=1 Tax=Vibrio albus TaxID=2200953 RepID=A0A2U3BB43_9VIBR|nr:cytochrome bd oxidase small subunit, CydX/CbdX family [Vibrio albus]
MLYLIWAFGVFAACGFAVYMTQKLDK